MPPARSSAKASSATRLDRREPYPTARASESGANNTRLRPERAAVVAKPVKPKSLLDGHIKKEACIKALKTIDLKIAKRCLGAKLERSVVIDGQTGKETTSIDVTCVVCLDRMCQPEPSGRNQERYPTLIHDTHALCTECAHRCVGESNRCPVCRAKLYLSDEEWDVLKKAEENNQSARRLIQEAKRIEEALSALKPSGMDKFAHTRALEKRAVLHLEKMQSRYAKMEQDQCAKLAEDLMNARCHLMELRGQRFHEDHASYYECFAWKPYHDDATALYSRKCTSPRWERAHVKVNSEELYETLWTFFEAGLSKTLKEYQPTLPLAVELHPLAFHGFKLLEAVIERLNGRSIQRGKLWKQINGEVKEDEILSARHTEGTMRMSFHNYMYDMVAHVVLNAKG